MKSAVSGMKYPRPTPKAIARNIHSVKKRSSSGNLLVMAFCSALFMLSSILP
jgi:hypothetical protein